MILKKRLYNYIFDRANKVQRIRNNFLIRFKGKSDNIVCIYEYPKCGATWFKHMLVEASGVEYRKGNRVKGKLEKRIGLNSIVQRHSIKNFKRYSKVFVIIRDPRDILNSFYFHQLYYRKNKDIIKKIDFVANENDSLYMQRFIKLLFEEPQASVPGFTISEFWDACKVEPDICLIKYEDLKNNTSKELNKALKHINISLDEYRVNEIVEMYSFKNMSNRNSENSQKENHIRKGVIGDWANNFNDETKALVEKKLSTTIEEMGYTL